MSDTEDSVPLRPLEVRGILTCWAVCLAGTGISLWIPCNLDYQAWKAWEDLLAFALFGPYWAFSLTLLYLISKEPNEDSMTPNDIAHRSPPKTHP